MGGGTVMSGSQEYFQRGWRVEISLAAEMWDMGIPEALEKFEHHLAAVPPRSSTTV